MIEIIFAVSTHFLPGEWNEAHPGLRFEQAPFMGAFFVNSEDNPSLALGLIGRADVFGQTVFGEIGGATGYSGGDVVPFLRAGLETGNLRLWVSPAATTKGEVGLVAGLDIIAVRF